MTYPYNLIRDSSSGTLYIADTLNHRVVRYTTGTTSGTVVASGNGIGTGTTQLNYAVGLYLDSSSSSLIIANAAANNIVRWSIGASSWTIVPGSSSGTTGSSSTMLYYPVGVTFDRLGNMYVAATYNHRIQLFSNGGQSVTTIAGSLGLRGSNSSLLNYPYSVTLDDNLNLYVVDGGNHRIEKILRY